MPSETEVTTDRMQWGQLIRAIAAHQDRSAFATLFEYFGPRIKAFMQRSGVYWRAFRPLRCPMVRWPQLRRG